MSISVYEFIDNMFGSNIQEQMAKGKKIIEIPNTNRESLAELLGAMGLNNGAEIGVERGLYSKVLLEKNPKLFLHSIDAWTAYSGYRDHVDQNKMNQLLADARENLAKYSGRNVLLKLFSVEASKGFNDGSLDFVYIDGNHEYAQTVADISAWDRKVRVGGIVAGHDYIRRRHNGYLMHVMEAVGGWVEAYQIAPLLILGRKEKLPGEKRDDSRSWFYVKQAPREVVKGFGA